MKKIVLLAATLFSLNVAHADEGMWLLSKIGKNMEKMKALGLELSQDQIYSTDAPSVKDAIVGLGREGRPFAHFCSGELISDQGLLLTNHHCGFDAIQSHSSVEHNYLQDGFWAYNKKEELTNPGLTASILDYMEDVTPRFDAVLNDKMTREERKTAIDSLTKVIVKEVTEKNKDVAAQVQPMFEGNQFFLFVYTIYKDVRLVGAPPQSMGKFGGDTDNWMWPRHTADFCMFRIYTAPDGKPAAYSKDNVPLKPKHHLPVSAKGIQDGDYAMILGFPGSTDRFTTSFGLENTMNAVNANRHKIRTEVLDVMRGGMDSSEKVKIQYASKYARCANYWKYSNEQNKALTKLNTMGNKQEIEREFTTWVNSSADRKAQYGTVLTKIKEAYAKLNEFATAQLYLQETMSAVEAPAFAYRMGGLISRYTQDSTSTKDKEKIKKQLLKMGDSFYKDFNTSVDENMLARIYKMYSANIPTEFQPSVLAEINKKYKGNFASYAAKAAKNSVFMSHEKFNAFVEKPSMKVLEKDMMYQAGKSFFSEYMKLKSETAKFEAQIEDNNRLFVRGLMQMDPERAWAPNANSTIRLTYGKVGSYKPRDAVFYDYQTTMTGIIEKEGPKGGEFEVPARLIKLYNKKDFGAYGKDDVVTCFITDNDITGGNSGSGVINAKGELIGTAFDGNSEAMSGDIDFEENLQRCINIDTRYMLWIVDKFAGAKNLIEEMTIVTE